MSRAVVTGFALVKDEADIIERTVRWMLGQVDRVVVVDNGSTDGTVEILEGLPVELRHDDDPKHYQARKLTAIARGIGSGFVVPFDADEIWYTVEGRGPTIADLVRHFATRAWIFTAELLEHVPTDGVGEHPFDRMCFRRKEANPLLKVSARTHPTIEFAEGAHSVAYNGDYPATLPFKLEVRHFPYRSPKQFVSKVRNGYNGRTAAVDLPDEVSPHLRRFGEMLDKGGEEALEEYFWSNIYRETYDPDLVRDPCPA